MKPRRTKLLEVAIALGLAGCGGTWPLEGAPDAAVDRQAAPAPGTPLFAFKAGIDGAEQVWLWMVGDGLHRVSTWPSEDPGSARLRSSLGYHEGSGRFGHLHFDHQRRFLLMRETMTEVAPPHRPVSRVTSYELATGRVVASPPLGVGVEIVSTRSTTLVLTPARSGAIGRWLQRVEGGVLVPVGGDATVGDPAEAPATAADVGGEPLVATGQLVLERRDGRFRAVAGLPADRHWRIADANHRDAACLIGSTNGREAILEAWLVTAGDPPRRLPCEGRTYGCVFAPDGDRVYLPGCAMPVVGRDQTAHPAPRVSLHAGAHVRVGEAVASVGVVGSGSPTLPRLDLVAFDWRMASVSRLLEDGVELPSQCSIVTLAVPPDGVGFALVRMTCGGTDSYNGPTFAIDLQRRKLHELHPSEAVFLHGATPLPGAAVTTVTRREPAPGEPDAPAALTFIDAGGSRVRGPLPGVRGPIHDLVRY